MRKVVSMFVFIVLLASFCSGLSANDAVDGRYTENRGGTKVKEFVIIADEYSFEPNVLRVNKGEYVRITVKSMDKVYGFNIARLGFKELVNPGYPHQFIFKAEREGMFRIRSHIYAGAKTGNMRGLLIVE